MAIWKQDNPPSRETVAPSPEPSREIEARNEAAVMTGVRSRSGERAAKESLIAEEITIEGKIEGSGHVRIAGRFKGDVNVKGNLAIEAGATVTGGVRASTVTIGGSLEGNIDGAERVELLETGVLTGDLSADSLTVAAGSRMRGKVEFGWDRKEARIAGAISDRTIAAAG